VSTGQVADLLRSPGRLSTTTVRKIFCISGLLLSSVFVIVSGFLGCDRVLVVLSMMAAMACISTVWASLSVNPMDLSTTHAATLFGIMNTSAGIAFIGTPQTIGVITYNNPSRAQWQKVFYITAGIEWFGAIVYLLFASGKPQNWHDDANSTWRPFTQAVTCVSLYSIRNFIRLSITRYSNCCRIVYCEWLAETQLFKNKGNVYTLCYNND